MRMDVITEEETIGGDSSDLVIVVPVYDDWDALQKLLASVETVLCESGQRARLLVIDDGSSIPCPNALVDAQLQSIQRIDLLTLRRNLGHQRALAVGLSFVEREIPCRAVLIMDGDGQDSPNDIPHLIQRMEDTNSKLVIFAARTRRSEGLAFKYCYALYRVLHHVLTGVRVRVGNFSIVPRAHLERLVVVSDLWRHYAASVHESRIPFESIPTRRAERLGGESKMSFVGLVAHGFSAMAVFGSRIGVRMLITNLVIMLPAVVFLSLAFAALFTTGGPIPGEAVYMIGLLVVIFLQSMLFSVIFVFFILAGRGSPGFLPIRDYRFFIAGFRPMHSAHD